MGSRGTIYGAPPIRSELDSCAVPSTWLGDMRAGLACIQSFKRATLQTLSLFAVRSFFGQLDSDDWLLARLGWVLLGVVPMFALLAYLVPGPAHTVNPWIRPIKFSVSFATYVWTASLFFRYFQLPRWQEALARRATTVSVIAEMLLLGLQAWRNAHPDPSQSLSNGMISQGVTAMVSVNTVVMLWMLALCWGGRARTLESSLIAAIRNSIVIFLVGNAVGGYMLARGSHTVGAPDGSPGLPFTNWSTIGGDLRIAHFIAVHAIQIVPLFAWLLLQMEPQLKLRIRRLAVLGMSAGVMLVVVATFIQAALGHPLLPLGR